MCRIPQHPPHRQTLLVKLSARLHTEFPVILTSDSYLHSCWLHAVKTLHLLGGRGPGCLLTENRPRALICHLSVIGRDWNPHDLVSHRELISVATYLTAHQEI